MSNDVVFSVTENEVVPILIEANFPVVNRKATSYVIYVYTGLGLYQGKKGVYLIARKWRNANTAPIGSIVYLDYSTGSHKHTHNHYVQFFVVAPVGERKVMLKDRKGNQDIEVRVLNLVPLEEMPEEVKREIEAEILNRKWLPSEYDPVKQLYYYWIRQKVHEKAMVEEEATAVGVEGEQEQQQPQQAPQPQISLEEIKPQELEVEIPEAPQSPQSQSQPQQQAQPPMEVELETTPTTPTPQPTKQELVRIYLLAMRLPTKHLLMQSEYERDGNGVLREVRRWDAKTAQIASRVEGIRRDAYARLSRVFCHVEEYGVWVTVSEDGVKEAQEVSKFVIEELKRLGIDKIKNISIEGRYGVRVVPIYLEPEEAKNLLETAVAHLSRDVEELSQKIEEAKKNENKKYLRQLESERRYRVALLEAFRRYLASL
jgi:transposase-like protein